MEFDHARDEDRFAKQVGGDLGLERRAQTDKYGVTAYVCRIPPAALPEVLARQRAHHSACRAGVGAVPDGEAE